MSSATPPSISIISQSTTKQVLPGLSNLICKRYQSKIQPGASVIWNTSKEDGNTTPCTVLSVDHSKTKATVRITTDSGNEMIEEAPFNQIIGGRCKDVRIGFDWNISFLIPKIKFMFPTNCTNIQFNKNGNIITSKYQQTGLNQKHMVVSDIIFVNKEIKRTLRINPEEEDIVDWTIGNEVTAYKSLTTVIIDGYQYPIYVRAQDVIFEKPT